MDRAKQQLIDNHRVDTLRQQVADWRLANDIRAWVATTRSKHQDQDEPALGDWLTWAQVYADQIDTTSQAPKMPPPPPVSAEALRPFLGNFSPYEPPAV